jgi:hypothetical protein
LIERGVPFIDVGIGIQVVDNFLIGHVRTTLSTPDKNDHIFDRISFNEGMAGEYSTNIQIAELNSLNASLAIIKWKKYFGFYQDVYREQNSIFNLNTGDLINEDNYRI